MQVEWEVMTRAHEVGGHIKFPHLTHVVCIL